MGPRQRRVVWSQTATEQLDEAIEFIAKEYPARAWSVLERVLQAAESLCDLSERGQMVRERDDPNVRELLIDPYRLIYDVAGAEVTILGIIHQRRDIEQWTRPDRD